MKLVYASRWWVGGYILVQRGGDWAGRHPGPSSLFQLPNVTAHLSTASVPITVLFYNGTLPCSFNVPIKSEELIEVIVYL